MSKLVPAWCLFVTCSVCVGGEPRSNALGSAESRLRAIYDGDEFHAAVPRADWLPDISGFTVVETLPDTGKRVRVRYDLPAGKRTVLDTPAQQPAGRGGIASPDGKSLLVAVRGDLYVRPFGDGATTRLTDSGGGPVSNGRAAWSPDGERVAFVQSDESLVKLRSYLAPGDPTYPEVRATRFARVGGSIPKLRVGVVDAKRKTTRWLPVPDPQEGHYLGQVGWAGNDEVLIEWLSRFRNEREFLLADVRSGTVRRTFRESETAWVVASYETNAGLDWLDGGKAFLVLSEMDGWRHAYSYARDGSKKTLLTPGDFDVIGRAKIDEAGGWLYYYASPDNATQKYLYRVPLSGTGKAERVTPAGQPGTHDYDFSPDAKWALHTHSTFDRPPVTELVEVPSHRVVRVLEDNKALRERMESVTPRPTEFFTLKAGGVSMDAWMIKPKSFDPEKKYPVFVYVYGEPHAQTVLDAWGKSHADYHRVIADLGYLVVSIENRGTPAPKGAAWRRAVFGCLGPITVEDQAAALKELGKQRPYVDLSRVGIWGWSGGGSNTLNALFRRPDTFHVGIAVAPKPQPQLYNAWFQEIYMGTPETNPDGYRRSAPINFAEGLKGDLLIVHGTGETNTHLPITEGLIDRLIELGKRFDYMAYPNRDHGLREGKGTAVHLRLLMARYLTEHLPPGPR